jgi:RNA polymerase sigma-70 factor (ECF subfamily)
MKNTDLDNFNYFLKDIQPNLLRFIRSICYHKQDSEDILQKTNIILINNKLNYDPSKCLRAWSFEIARYQILAHRTRLARSKVIFNSEMISNVLSEEEEKEYPLEKRKKVLFAQINNLSPALKKIAILRFKDNLSYEDICKKTNKSQGYVCATISRAKEKLSNQIRELSAI